MPQEMPLPPWILADALQDRIHATSGPLIAAKAIQVEPSSGAAGRHCTQRCGSQQ
jgi:hypothetical protein